MKKNPGRKERRFLTRKNKLQDGRKRAKAHNYRQSHYWLKKFNKVA